MEDNPATTRAKPVLVIEIDGNEIAVLSRRAPPLGSEAASQSSPAMDEEALEPEDSELLDIAAAVAAQHSALNGCESDLRSLLSLVTLRSELARQIGGDPRRVVDEAGEAEMLRAKMRGEVMQTVWREDMLAPKDVAVALGANPTNREKVRQYRDRSWLVGLPAGRGYLYPAFQFDPRRRDVFPEVREVNLILGAVDDPWGVASWWISEHARLRTRPADIVGTSRADDLLAAAGAMVEPIG